MHGRLPSGVQLDIEPYLLEGFFNDSSGFIKYLDMHARVKRVPSQSRLAFRWPCPSG
jgi:hypothetical protein